MITVNASRREPICLRHQGENDAMRVAFPLSAFEADWPGGTPLLLVQRPRSSRDAEAYPVALSVDGHTAYWTVSASDVEYSGYGKAQLQWRVEDVLVKSCIYDTVCVPSLHAGADPPDEPSKRWFDAIQTQIGNLDDLTTEEKKSLVAAINEAARSGGGSGGAGTIDMRVADGYIQYSNDDGTTWENLIAIAELKGADGKDGANGTDGKDGAPGKDGTDGKDGAPGKDGTDGITPTIGENGNWYIGTEDTGKPSRGETGPQGADGKDGTNGTDGADGHTPVITASKSGKVTTIKADGEAIATVNDGADGTNGTDGAPGKDGADGAPGKDGVTPDIKIGTVTTLPAGSEATASMGGTAAQPTLNLGIPKGANGDNANVTKDAVVGALGFTPIGADDVPVKSVNGQTGTVKTNWYFNVTGSVASPATTQTAAQIVAAQTAGFAPICKAVFSDFKGLPATLPALLISDMTCVFGGIGSTGGDTFYLTVMIDGAGNLTAKTDSVVVKEADIEKALGYKPIGAADVPVKKVNGATGDVKSTFYVTITSAEDESISADKTLKEIYTAYEKGYAVYAKTAASPQIIVPLTIAVHSGNDYAVVFNGAVTFGDTTEYAISNDGSGWTIYAKDIAFKDNIPDIPAVTTADNGKILRVVNGAWAAAELLSAGGASF